MQLPFALDHINLWLLKDADDAGRESWAIVDCGVANEVMRSACEHVFAHHLDGLPVLRVIVTHMHSDPIGNAAWLTQRWGCRLWISATDWNAARISRRSTTGFGGDAAVAFFREHGLVDPDAVAKVRARSNCCASMVPDVPDKFRRLDGHATRIGAHDRRRIVGYGPSPEHIAPHCPTLGVLISGGHGVAAHLDERQRGLPRIRTRSRSAAAVPVVDRPPGALPRETLVLPSQGKPFKGLNERASAARAIATSASPPATDALAVRRISCLCCSAGSSTCTRRRSRWARRSRTCMRRRIGPAGEPAGRARRAPVRGGRRQADPGRRIGGRAKKTRPSAAKRSALLCRSEPAFFSPWMHRPGE